MTQPSPYTIVIVRGNVNQSLLGWSVLTSNENRPHLQAVPSEHTAFSPGGSVLRSPGENAPKSRRMMHDDLFRSTPAIWSLPSFNEGSSITVPVSLVLVSLGEATIGTRSQTKSRAKI